MKRKPRRIAQDRPRPLGAVSGAMIDALNPVSFILKYTPKGWGAKKCKTYRTVAEVARDFGPKK